MSDQDDWRGIRRDVNRGGRLTVGWVLAILGVFAVIAVSIWVFNVATSDIKGQGDAVQQKNSAANRLDQQGHFNDLYQHIKQTDRKITDAKAQWDANPQDAVLRTNFTGLRNGCLTAVGDYNSLARKYLAQDFRDADLPSEIDLHNKETDCEPNVDPSTPAQPEETK